MPEALARLMAYRWPGDVRELANAMERAALLSEGDAIPARLLDFLPSRPSPETRDAGQSAVESLDDALRARIEAALSETGGNIRRTATVLGISRNTLRARMDRYGLRERHPLQAPASRDAPPPPATPSAPVEWERRHLAFLRVRVRPSPTVDLRRALEVAGEKVTSFGGRIEESGPTGLVAVFGLEPVDNPASHAALAALAIQNAATRARATGGESADVVVGIECADHLVGRRAAMAQLAVEGKAATSSALAGLFETRLGQCDPRRGGRSAVPRAAVRARAPVRAPSVLAPAPRRCRGRREPPAVRRPRAEQHHGQVVGIVGEAGVGKSRLMHEVTRQLQGWRILRWAAEPYAGTTSYFAIVELLKAYCRVEDADVASTVQAKVAGALSAGGCDVAQVAPAILDPLAVLPADDPFRRLEPAVRRQRTLEAIKRVVLAAGGDRPLCLIVEDLHWIDPASEGARRARRECPRVTDVAPREPPSRVSPAVGQQEVLPTVADRTTVRRERRAIRPRAVGR